MVKINRLEIENVKRVQAVQVEPFPSGLTVIGGRNGQGKTSVLDAIIWALGGNRYKPSDPKRDGSLVDPRIQIQLDNGLVVTREGKNATLKVIDPAGNKGGQALLDDLIEQLALDLPKFLNGSAKEKGETLLQIIGVGDQLAKLDQDAERLYNERHAIGQVYTRKQKHAEDLPFEQGAPDEEVSAGELIQQQQVILAKNGENQRLRANRDELERRFKSQAAEATTLQRQFAEADGRLTVLRLQLQTAGMSVQALVDESTAELEVSLQQIDETNRRVRINTEKHRAEADAASLAEQIESLTRQLEMVRQQRQQLLASATLPLPGLSVADGELTYQGQKWDCLAGSDQLRVAVAIVRQLRPSCQFVLLDKLEQMDLDTLRDFGDWLEEEGLQAIATRVSTGGECSLIIEDGLVVGAPIMAPTVPPALSFDTEGF